MRTSSPAFHSRPSLPERLNQSLSEAERLAWSDIAAGRPLQQVLDRVLNAVELEADGDLFASILLVDETGTRLVHGAAPSLPPEYCAAVDGIAIGPGSGSCGTAAWLGHPVYVIDTRTDPLWADFRELALMHGLRACWSTPLNGADRKVIATFAVYYATQRSPTAPELRAIAMISRVARDAIERSRALPAGSVSKPPDALRSGENWSGGQREIGADFR